jgi:hypothetical protein
MVLQNPGEEKNPSGFFERDHGPALKNDPDQSDVGSKMVSNPFSDRLTDPWASPHYNMSGIISSVLYAQPGATIILPGNEPGLWENLIMSMEISTTGAEEERIAALETRVRYMDALVKGLVAEMLDLKTVAMAFSRQDGERSRKELKQGTVVRGTVSPELAGPSTTPPVDAPADGTTVIRPKGAPRQDVPAAPAEPAMVRIMQSDGTMKLEPRFGNKKTF